MDLLDIGMIIDIITTYVNGQDESNKNTKGVREATQSDFDNF